MGYEEQQTLVAMTGEAKACKDCGRLFLESTNSQRRAFYRNSNYRNSKSVFCPVVNCWNLDDNWWLSRYLDMEDGKGRLRG
jgi:hypothetical protein